MAAPEDAIALEPGAIGPAVSVDRDHTRSSSAWRGAGLLVVGIGLVLVGTMALTAVTSLVCWPLALAGLWLGWRGLRALTQAAWGPNFDTGFWLAVAWVGVVVALAALAGVLPFQKPHALPLHAQGFVRPSLFSGHLLGTDDFGRDELSRVVYGARVSLVVGVGGTMAGMAVGGVLGLAAGFYRGAVERVVDIVADSALAFPPLVLLLALVTMLRPSLGTILVGLGVLTVPTFIRLAKANTILQAHREYVLAARALGARTRRLLFRELLPNIVLPLASYGFVSVAALMVAEASLSYLNLGIKAPYPSWGNMVAEVQTSYTDNPHTVLVPGLALFLTVFALNRIGDRARLRWDPLPGNF